MDSVRNIEFLELGEQRIEVGMAVRLAHMVKRRDECATASVLDRALQLGSGGGNVEHRELRNRDEAPARVAAEIRDPSVVGTAVRVAEFRVLDLRFPQQPDGRIKNRL